MSSADGGCGDAPARPADPVVHGVAGRIELKIAGEPGGARLVFSERDGTLTVETVFVPPRVRAAGLGSALMERVLAIADRLGIPAELTARPIGHHGPEATARLVRFYRRFGFEVVNAGETVPRMVRPAAGPPGPGSPA